jgi:hypothetical protein
MISFLNVIPLLLLFIVFFMAFSFVETVILLAIKHYLREYWVAFVDKFMKSIIFHGRLVRLLAVGSLALLLSLMVLFTPLFDILVGGKDAIRILGGVLIVEMVVIFLVSNREVAETKIERQIHLYVFTFFSITAYTVIMLMANKSYAGYQETVNQGFVYPIIHSIEANYETRVEDRLIEVMREQIKEGECQEIDYAKIPLEPGLIQFAHVRNDVALAESGYVKGEPVEEGQPLRGEVCTHETKFLLTPDGKWYEVLQAY